jgi:GST-like protein
MIDLYTWTTPNGRKASIMLEEVGLPYTAHAVNIGNGEQFEPDFLKISPNNKIPAIVDQEAEGGPRSLFESGAILIYLAEKTGQLFPVDGPGRSAVLEWLMWQMGNVGPMFGQYTHFRFAAKEHVPYGIERYDGERKRLLSVMETRLSALEYLAGNDYSIADIATYPWVQGMREFDKEFDWSPYPSVTRYLDQIGERLAVERGMAVPQT